MTSSWIKLNVGGQLFQTTLTTLRSWPSSLLANMFDPESGFAPPYSENGVYFLDADPKYFSVILNWLRYGKIMVEDIDPRNVATVADYFGLEKLVKEIREMGAIVITNDERDEKCPAAHFGDCLGLYLKQADNSYRQAGGRMYLYQASGGVWYINETLTERDGQLFNRNSKESNTLPRTDWEYLGDTDEKSFANLRIIDIEKFTFCNVITISSTNYSKKEFLGEFRIVSDDWRNGWPVYKNKEDKYLFVSQAGYCWCVSNQRNKLDKGMGNYQYVISSSKVTSCPAHDQSGTWKYREERGHLWIDDETIKVECDVHNHT